MTLTHNDHSRSNERSKLMPSSHISPKATRSGFLTVTGTIKNGKNKGITSWYWLVRFSIETIIFDSGECFDVQLKMNRDRLADIEKEANLKKPAGCCCGLNRGLHIFITSLFLVPFMWIFCTFYAFYMGTITWYNIFIYYNEQRSCCHTVIEKYKIPYFSLKMQ